MTVDTEMWLEAGIGSQEMYRAAETLESWFGWRPANAAVRAAIAECQDLHFQLAALEGEQRCQEEEARAALLAELGDDPTADEIAAFAVDEERFDALVGWWRADAACAPTGAPSAEALRALRALAERCGYTAWARALAHPWDLL